MEPFFAHKAFLVPAGHVAAECNWLVIGIESDCIRLHKVTHNILAEALDPVSGRIVLSGDVLRTWAALKKIIYLKEDDLGSEVDRSQPR